MTAPTREQLLDLLRRCRSIVQSDAQMMADISRHSPLDPQSQVLHDSVVYESEQLLPLIDAALAAQPASGSGAELVREIEDDPGLITGEFTTTENWDRLRAALISADAAREDAERLATAHESVLRSLQKQAPRFEDTDRLDAIESQSWCVGKYETNRFYVHLGQINGKQCETTGATLREAIDRARGGGDA